ncbi:zinc-binding alcohol dehydrogenase family protein [Massilia sp. DWR3-1-1]|uniref:zinc-binding alcohol dehydrogenase family protein n=1 Tax=Massilia sp. DWR3-1-1 TaxID=2804559 RepID=UPI003CE861D3
MKAVGYHHCLPIDDPLALEDLVLPAPTPLARDLLVRVRAVSVNPVDTKIRLRRAPADGQTAVLGWDAVGIVEAMGADVTGFAIGDRVFYAGALDRPGSNSELQLVDERIVARAPASLSDSEAAALPLTAITAWELLFDRLRMPLGGASGKTLLIVGGAGGVGSILIQLARQLTGLRVVATASRAATRDWCLALGAHLVLDHAMPLAPQLAAAGIDAVDAVASLTHTEAHYADLIACIRPQGQLALIDDPAQLDAVALKTKSISLHWELMFTRSLFHTDDMAEQGKLLARVAALVDEGRIRTTLNASFGTITAANLRRAHALLESGTAQGKVVLAGF